MYYAGFHNIAMVETTTAVGKCMKCKRECENRTGLCRTCSRIECKRCNKKFIHNGSSYCAKCRYLERKKAESNGV